MEYIKRYLYAIEKRLPASNKKDVVKEIESLIMDELEGKFGSKPVYGDKEIQQVLTEMGHPIQVSMRYRGEKEYFIGPELFYFFKLLLTIVCGAVTLGLVVSFVVGSFSLDANVWDVLKKFLLFLPSLIPALLSAVGSVTIVFFLIQKFAKPDQKIDLREEWTVKDLAEIPQNSDRVKRAEPIIAICLTIIFAIFINLYCRNSELLFGSSIHFMQIFDLNVARQILPLWNISIGITLALQTILLFKGKWNIATRIVDVFESLFSIYILAFMLKIDMLIATNGLTNIFNDGGFIASHVEKYYYIGLKWIVVITIIAIIVKTITLIVKSARKAGV
jgi:hypothetical protein